MVKSNQYKTLDDALLQKWHKLWNESESGHFFNTPEWFLSYCETYGIKKSLLITIEDNDTLVLILPLVLENVFGISSWVSPGGKFLNKSTLLAKYVDKKIATLLRQQLTELKQVYLRELLEKHASLITAQQNGWRKQEASLNPYLPLSHHVTTDLSPKLQSQIRNSLKKHENSLRFIAYTGDLQALETTFALDAISSKAKQGKATFTPKDQSFFKTLLQRMPEQMVIDLLFYDNAPVIYGIGLTYKKTYEAFLTAYDATYRKIRPGKLLTFALLKRLQQTPLTLFDFSRGNSSLKQEFTKDVRRQYTVFYTHSIVIRLWWVFADYLYNIILDSKILYTIYLFIKGMIRLNSR